MLTELLMVDQPEVCPKETTTGDKLLALTRRELSPGFTRRPRW
jgi:hypothetical protein